LVCSWRRSSWNRGDQIEQCRRRRALAPGHTRLRLREAAQRQGQAGGERRAPFPCGSRRRLLPRSNQGRGRARPGRRGQRTRCDGAPASRGPRAKKQSRPTTPTTCLMKCHISTGKPTATQVARALRFNPMTSHFHATVIYWLI